MQVEGGNAGALCNWDVEWADLKSCTVETLDRLSDRHYTHHFVGCIKYTCPGESIYAYMQLQNHSGGPNPWNYSENKSWDSRVQSNVLFPLHTRLIL